MEVQFVTITDQVSASRLASYREKIHISFFATSWDVPYKSQKELLGGAPLVAGSCNFFCFSVIVKYVGD